MNPKNISSVSFCCFVPCVYVCSISVCWSLTLFFSAACLNCYDDIEEEEQFSHGEGRSPSVKAAVGSSSSSSSSGSSNYERSSSSADGVAASPKQQHTSGSDRGGDVSRGGSVRRGVSFVEANDETSKKGQQQQQQGESHGRSHSSSSLPRERKHLNAVIAAESHTGENIEEATDFSPAGGEREGESVVVGGGSDKITRAASVSNRLKTSFDTTLGGLGAGALEETEGMMGGRSSRRNHNNYVGEGSNSSGSPRAGLETSNAFSSLLNGRDNRPLFLRAPVRLIASWQAHRDGLKSMQLLRIRRNDSRRRRATSTAAAAAATAAAAAASPDMVAARMNTTAAGGGAAGRSVAATPTASGCQDMTQRRLRNTGRKRSLLLTAGGDGAARLWDISGVVSDVTVPALFLDIAQAAASAGERRTVTRPQYYSSSAAAAAGGDISRCTALVPSSSAADTYASALGRTTDFHSRYDDLPGRPAEGRAAAAAGRAGGGGGENSLLLQQQQSGHSLVTPSPSFPFSRNGMGSLQSHIVLVGDLHAQSSNAVAAATGETYSSSKVPRTRGGVQIQQPRRLWQLDLDKEEEEAEEEECSGSAEESCGYSSSYAGEEASSSDDECRTENVDVSHMRLLQLHTRIKEMEEQQQQHSARHGENMSAVEPSLLFLLPSPLLSSPACLLPRGDSDLLSSDMPLALADRRASDGGSSHSSNSSSGA